MKNTRPKFLTAAFTLVTLLFGVTITATAQEADPDFANMSDEELTKMMGQFFSALEDVEPMTPDEQIRMMQALNGDSEVKDQEEDLFADVFDITLVITEGDAVLHTVQYNVAPGGDFETDEVVLADTGYMLDVEGELRQVSPDNSKAVFALEINLSNEAQKQNTLNGFLGDGADPTKSAMTLAMTANLDRSFENDRLYVAVNQQKEVYATGPLGDRPGFAFTLLAAPM